MVAQATSDDRCQFRRQVSSKINGPARLHRDDVREPWIFSNVDLGTATQRLLSRRHLAQSCLLVEAGIYRVDTNGHEAATGRPRPLAADYSVGVEVAKCDGSEEINAKRFGVGDQGFKLLLRCSCQLQTGSPA